tara:strand:+ start:508 stop:714 length:207 start_codon:yes stop_codon:yes gene_type:complete
MENSPDDKPIFLVVFFGLILSVIFFVLLCLGNNNNRNGAGEVCDENGCVEPDHFDKHYSTGRFEKKSN